MSDFSSGSSSFDIEPVGLGEDLKIWYKSEVKLRHLEHYMLLSDVFENVNSNNWVHFTIVGTI